MNIQRYTRGHSRASVLFDWLSSRDGFVMLSDIQRAASRNRKLGGFSWNGSQVRKALALLVKSGRAVSETRRRSKFGRAGLWFAAVVAGNDESKQG